MLASTPLHSMVTSGLFPPRIVSMSKAISSAVFFPPTCQKVRQLLACHAITIKTSSSSCFIVSSIKGHLISVGGSHTLGNLQPVVHDVGYDNLGCPHGLGGEEVDQAYGSRPTDQDLFAKRHSSSPMMSITDSVM